MKQKTSYKRLCFKTVDKENQQMQDFFNIFTRTLKPDMGWVEFKIYFQSGRLDYIDVTLVLLNGLIVGFCSAAFYKNVIDGRDVVIGRAATGMPRQYMGARLPKYKLYAKYMWYWLKHPFTQFWYVSSNRAMLLAKGGNGTTIIARRVWLVFFSKIKKSFGRQ